MDKIAVIDGDSIIHIVSYHFQATGIVDSNEDMLQELYESMNHKPVLDRVDSFVTSILKATKATGYVGFLGARSGSDTFRHRLAVTKPYKGQRGSTPHWTKFWKPIIIEHLVSGWKFQELFNIEADDACRICSNMFTEYVICSPDKDLKQIAGEHYDYRTLEHTYVSPKDSLVQLYRQVLIGDSTDNIPGCPKVGAKSPFLDHLEALTTEEEFVEYTKSVYETRGVLGMYEEQLSLVKMLDLPDGQDIKGLILPNVWRPETESVEEFSQESDIGIPATPPVFGQ